MQIKYTKRGMEITHSSGVIQILSVEGLTCLKNSQEQHQVKAAEGIARIDTHIAEAQKKVSHG